MNDTVTIITSATNNQIVKSFGGPDYQQLKFSPGLEFLAFQHPVDDLQSLASVIGRLEGEPTKAVIRGLPLLPENDPAHRHSTADYQYQSCTSGGMLWRSYGIA